MRTPRYQAFLVFSKSILMLALITAGCFAFVKIVFASPTFNSNSSNLTNKYMPMKFGDKLTYQSYGLPYTYYLYANAVGKDNIDNVECLKVKITASILPSYAEYAWYAQDTSGNIWILQNQDTESGIERYGVANAEIAMPSLVKIGTVISPNETVVAIGVTVPKLSNGLGPYYNCMKTKLVYPDGDIDYQYYASSVGLVKVEANDDGGTNGVEIMSITEKPKSMPWLPLLLNE